MKIRMGFVTNSSSTSYVIGYKGETKFDKETLEKYPFLTEFNKMIKTMFGDVVITSKEEFLEHLNEEFDWKEKFNSIEEFIKDEGIEEPYEKLMAKLEEGYILFFREVSYYDDTFESLYDSLKKNENTFVEECYF